jgi:hypothetical protein
LRRELSRPRGARLRASSLRGLGLKRGGLVRDRGWQRWRERGRSSRRLGRRGRRCWNPRRLRRPDGGGLPRRRHSYRRWQGLGLPAWICNCHRVRHVVDHDGVVDVVVDHIAWRRRHISRRTDPDRNRPVGRYRQHENSDRRRWRCEHHEFGWRWGKEDHWRGRRWCEGEYWIVKNENRPADINDFFWRGRGQVIGHGRERRRRLECGGKIGQATVRIGCVRPLRIPPQI